MPDSPKADIKEIEEGKVFAVISYLWILCIVALLVKKENKFAYFHARQGLVLFLIGVINVAVSMALPVISWLVTIPLSVALLICAIFGIVQSLMGNYARIPLVAELAEKINI